MQMENIYRQEWGRALSTLIRLLGDFDLAEESFRRPSPSRLSDGPTRSTCESQRVVDIYSQA